MTSVREQQRMGSSLGDWDHGLNRMLQDFQGPVTPQGQGNVSEFREYRTYSSSKKNDEPAQTTSEKWVEYSGAPVQRLKDSTYSSSNRERTMNPSVTPPPPQSQGLKTPPLVRKILQQSSTNHSSSSRKKTDFDSTKPHCARLPLTSSPVEPAESNGGARYYTSTTTRTQQDISPQVRTFPSSQPPPRDYYGEPPKRLDDLMSTFESSYTNETRRVHGDRSGPQHPHGHNEPARQVHINENVSTSRTTVDEEHARKNARSYGNPLYQPKETIIEPTRNVTGPPVFYPSDQVVHKIERESHVTIQEGGKGKMKAKRTTEYKVKEKSGSSHDGSKGKGAKGCQTACCVAPCTIM